MTKALKTKKTILAVARKLILQKGFSGTSLDEIILDSNITKGGFFYHFNGRNDLARQLILDYIHEDEEILRNLIRRATTYVSDPKDRVLIFLKLYIELLESLEENHPGCLIASYVYESNKFNAEIRNILESSVDKWTQEVYDFAKPAFEDIDSKILTVDQFPYMLYTIYEGAVMLTKIKKTNKILINQFVTFHNLVEHVLKS